MSATSGTPSIDSAAPLQRLRPIGRERPEPAQRSVVRRSQDGDELGEVALDPSWFGVEPNRAVLHQVVTAQLAAARAGSALHPDPRRGPGRRREAVPPKGDRPGPAGLDPCPAVRGWRYRRWVRSPAAIGSAPQRRWSVRRSSPPCRTGPPRNESPSSTAGAGRSRGPRTRSRRSPHCPSMAGCSW